MFFNEWYNKNTKSFLGKSTKEKMYMAHNYGFEEGMRMGKESVPIAHYLLQIQTLKQENDKFMICLNESIEACGKIISYSAERMLNINEGINPLTMEPYTMQEFCMETSMLVGIRNKLIAVRPNQKNEDESLRVDLPVVPKIADDKDFI
jgi:hypothetical protein